MVKHRKRPKPSSSSGFRIFISYRRADSEAQASHLWDDLTTGSGGDPGFGDGQVFMDVEIEPGLNFKAAIEREIAECDAFLPLIGPDWLSELERRLASSSDDYVRLEVEAAIRRDVAVVPILVRGASMPRPDQLPPSLLELSYRNALDLGDRRWRDDIARVFVFLRSLERRKVEQEEAERREAERREVDRLRAERVQREAREREEALKRRLPEAERRTREEIERELAERDARAGRYFAPQADLSDLGDRLSAWFRSRDLETQVLDQGSMVIVQARKGGGWRAAMGLSQALAVKLHQDGPDVIVAIGSSKWVDKMGIGVVGAAAFPPLVLTAAWGAWAQLDLRKQTLQMIRDYLAEHVHD